MDSISQAVLGAAIGEAVLGKKIGNKGAVVGAIIATIPDLDVIFYLFYDKLEMLSIHRGFSHSILFSILGALLIAFALSKIKWLQNIKFNRLLLFTWLCLFTHVLLDTFTAYGTQLFLPFSDQRVGFDSVNVIDPLYTVPLIIGLILSLWSYKSKLKRATFNNYGLLISSLYLIFTLIHKEFVKAEISTRMAQENIEYNSLLTMPVGIANINWYGVAKGRDSIYMLKYSILSDMEDSIEAFPIHEEYLDLIDKNVAKKMRWFAKGFYTVEKEDNNIRIYNLQVDMRGIIKTGTKKAPTAGYFEISNKDGNTTFSSGSIKN
ncbi:metal-dependent hydrolase [Kordia sp. YSTF-M3]|uniref:Metal-dependent hydrolase n=1 Tax=Kordia aestuariivivens TaxID=2759037 RepID=A0ABR7Q8G7_9FLAO|nr:metal-dependent hydrolase [Kordia aestuariivivens]MBC8754862.1 metal-dependent hydrolase [Kordia aestuariivivens]